jgi:DNA polymerase-3 subunit beta
MKLQVLTSNLQKKLPLLNHAISSKSQLPILMNILLEAKDGKLQLSSTDLEIGIEIFIPATILEEGGITVPAKTFSELISSLSDDMLTLETKETTLEVIGRKTRSVFQTISKDDFPKLYEERGNLVAAFTEDDLKKDFSSVVFSASADTTRPALSGVLIRKEEQGFLLVATDGYRLSLKHYKLASDFGDSKQTKSIIVPARVFRELMSIKEETKDIKMYVAEQSNQVLFEQGETVLVGRLIEAEFPPFEKIIPSDFSVSVAFDKEEMQKAVRICSIFAKDSANIIKLSFHSDHVTVSSQTPSVGENMVNVDAKLSGDENAIAFNARYLVDLFANVSASNMVFEMIGPLNAGVFRIADDASFLHLIMPIRVQG